MMEGEYTLRLKCDEKTGCTESSVIREKDRLHAKAEARMDGWLLKRDGNKCFCPKHFEGNMAKRGSYVQRSRKSRGPSSVRWGLRS